MADAPNPEVVHRPKRRTFTAEYKLRILAEADAAPEGSVGALLRREGIYYSHLIDWRNQRAKGTLGITRPGRPAKDPKDVELESVRAENDRLRRRLEQAEAVIDVQKKLSRLLGIDSETTTRGGKAMTTAAEELAPILGSTAACRVLGVSRATRYRRRTPPAPAPARPKRVSHRALSEDERQAVRGTAHSQRFADESPATIVATLLDEGTYLCSIRTMYRILAADGEVKERRNQLTHPPYARPELLAQTPNEVWSWDSTKLLGPAKWTYFYLLVMLDILSRYVVGWMVSEAENTEVAKVFVAETLAKQGHPKGLSIHADRGTAQTAKPLALLMADLGVTKSHSRPHTCLLTG